MTDFFKEKKMSYIYTFFWNEQWDDAYQWGIRHVEQLH